MLDFNPFKKTFALDISDTVARVACLHKKGKKNIITSLNEVTVPPNVIIDGEIKDINALQKVIWGLINNVKGKKLRTRYVSCTLPERKTFIKLIQMPKSKEAEIEDAIKWESSQHIPMNLDEMYLDWQIIDMPIDKENVNILIAAAPKYIVDSYAEFLESLKLKPVSFEMESIATTRSIYSSNKSSLAQCTLIVDFGGTHTNLIIYDYQTIQFSSSLPFSGNALTEIIAKKLKMKTMDAEKAKIIYGFEEKRGRGMIKKILEPEFDLLVDKIYETQNFYLNHFRIPSKFKRVILAGGGAQMKYLDLYLKNKMGVTVEVANPLNNIDVLKSYHFLKQYKTPSFTTVIGLALKNIDI